MSPRPIQYFSDAYLEQCRRMTPDQICRFLDDFRLMVADLASSELERVAADPVSDGPSRPRGP